SHKLASSGIQSLQNNFGYKISATNPKFSRCIVNGAVVEISSGEVVAQFPDEFRTTAAFLGSDSVAISDFNGRLAQFDISSD
ncbi:MAG: hypothetical protein AAFQ42_08575, partial [Pseudomonadota bacterium]